MKENICVTIKVQDQVIQKKYPTGIRIQKIADEFQKYYENDILLALRNHKLQELNKRLTKDCELVFMTYQDKCGLETYRRSATLLFLKAFHDVLGHKNIKCVRVDFAIGKGYYCKPDTKVPVTEEVIQNVKKRMIELVEAHTPIRKRSIEKEEAIRLFKERGMADKEHLFRFRRQSKVNLYSLDGFEDYFYGYMLPNAGYIKYFDLILYHDGIVLLMPERSMPKVVPEFKKREKLFSTLIETSKWIDMIHVSTVGELNDKIVNGDYKSIMLVSEALQEQKISEIAKTIALDSKKKFIMIAGPSSSGKTTFSRRLAVQLMANGLKPHPISVDNYFVNREDTPLDENGQHDFECLEAIDVKQFNQDMTELAEGKTVQLPEFNFITGKREYNGNFIKLGPDDVLVIEGIHCLNDQLSYSLPKEQKFKIYISALTQLNIDEHNRISTTDGRLIRRMVRDARTRGVNAQSTLNRWPSVRRGEEKFIFPYQEDADVMFNSALVYELSVLKIFVQPLLFAVPEDSPEYIEAKRLLKFLDYFVEVNAEDVPKNSLLREFVGGGCFHL